MADLSTAINSHENFSQHVCRFSLHQKDVLSFARWKCADCTNIYKSRIPLPDVHQSGMLVLEGKYTVRVHFVQCLIYDMSPRFP